VGGQEFFLLKRKGGPTLFWEKNIEIPQPSPPKKKRTFPKCNGMIVNPDEHQAMVLGNSDYEFSFPVKNSIDLLGTSIDSELSFNHHISKVCEKVNNSIQCSQEI